MERISNRVLAITMAFVLAIGLLPIVPTLAAANEDGEVFSDEVLSDQLVAAGDESDRGGVVSLTGSDAEAVGAMAAQEDVAIAITSGAEVGSTSVTVSVTGNDKLAEYGGTLNVYAIPTGDTFNAVSVGMGSVPDTWKQLGRQSNVKSSDAYEVALSSALEEGCDVVAYIRIFDWDADREYYPTSEQVTLSGGAVSSDPAIAIDGDIEAGASSVSLTVSGDLPSSAAVYIMSFDVSATSFGLWDDEAVVARKRSVAVGSHNIDISSQGQSLIAEGKKVVAYIAHYDAERDAIVADAQSEPVIVKAAAEPPVEVKPTVEITSTELTDESSELSANITGSDEIFAVVIMQFDPGDEVKYDVAKNFKFKVSGYSDGSNVFQFDSDRLTVGKLVRVCLLKYDGSTPTPIAWSDPVAVTAAAVEPEPAPDPEIAITGDVKAGDEGIVLEVKGDMTGKNIMVRAFGSSATTYPISFDPHGDGTVLYNKANASSGKIEAQLSGPVSEGQKLVAFIYDYDDDINIRKIAASAPVTVGAAETAPDEPVDPKQFTRADLVNGSYVVLASPNTEGAAAGKFLTTDRTATADVTLHAAVPSATLSVIAWPKTLGFGSSSGYVDSDDINRWGVNLFTAYNVKNGDEVNVVLNEDKFASISDPTAYQIIAYLTFADNTAEDTWPIVKAGAGMDIVDESGQSSASYDYPDASIVETELPTGATVMHVNLTGDERLFQIARDSKGSNDALQIRFMVIEYDADVTPETFDFEETPQVRLYSEDAYEAFENKEITLSEPLAEGKRVRAIVYTTQYSGSLSAAPIPASHDYEPSKKDDSVLVSNDAAPVVLNPAVSIDGSLVAGAESFDVKVANVPDEAIILVKAYQAADEIATNTGTFVASVTNPVATNTVNVPSNVVLAAGNRVVAFVLVKGELIAQSSTVTVIGEQSGAEIEIVGPVDKNDSSIVVRVNRDVPADAHISVRQFAEPVNTEWGSQNSVGSVDKPVSGDNTVTVSGIRRDYIVAFLATDYGNTIYAVSEPVATTHQAVAPTVSISKADVMFTEGDLCLNMAYSVDEYARDVVYTLYQYEGDVLDVDTAEAIATGTVVNSTSHSGVLEVSVKSPLRAGCKVQMVLTADGLSATSNALVVGAYPEWAKQAPTVGFGQDSISADATEVKVVTSFDEAGYEALGSEYYCNVAVYQIDAELALSGYTDEDLEDTPLTAAYRTDTRNDKTCGELTLGFAAGKLEAGKYLVVKLRLPDPIRQDRQSMWRDYVSEAIPVVSGDEQPSVTLWLYNLGADTENGAAVRSVAGELGYAVREFAESDLNQQVGFVIGREGFGETAEPFEGTAPDGRLVLIDGLDADNLDGLLDALLEAGVPTDVVKAITTDTNITWPVYQLIGDVSEEHEVMTAWENLKKLVAEAEALDEDLYDTDAAEWGELQDALESAQNLLAQFGTVDEEDEPSAEDYNAAAKALREALDAVAAALKQPMGDVLIDAEKAADGTYTLAVSVEGMSEEELAASTVTWSDGTSGLTRSGVSADELANLSVKVQSPKHATSSEGQMEKPQAPKDVKLELSDEGVAVVSWMPSEVGANQLPVDFYTVKIFIADEAGKPVGDPVATKVVDAETGAPMAAAMVAAMVAAAESPQVISVEFDGLDPDESYVVEVTASNDVGMSAAGIDAESPDGDDGAGDAGNDDGAGASDPAGEGTQDQASDPEGAKAEANTTPADGTASGNGASAQGGEKAADKVVPAKGSPATSDGVTVVPFALAAFVAFAFAAVAWRRSRPIATGRHARR